MIKELKFCLQEHQCISDSHYFTLILKSAPMWRLNIHIREERQSKYLPRFVTLNCHISTTPWNITLGWTLKTFPMMHISQHTTVCLGRSGFSGLGSLGKDRSWVCPSQISLFTWVFFVQLAQKCSRSLLIILFETVNSSIMVVGRPDCLQGSLGSCLHLSGVKSALVFIILKKIYYLVERYHTTKHI